MVQSTGITSSSLSGHANIETGRIAPDRYFLNTITMNSRLIKLSYDGSVPNTFSNLRHIAPK